MAEPLTINDFSGGITDQTLGSPLNQYVKGDNILVDPSKNAFSRPGSACFDSTNTQIPIGNVRVSTLINYGADTSLIAQANRKVYYYSAGWNEITGPSANSAMSVGTSGGRFNYSEWKGHLFLTNNEGTDVEKIYRNSGGTYKVLTAGLPKFANVDSYASTTVVTNAIRDLANGIRTSMKAHFVNATLHPVGTDTVSNGIIAAAALIAGDSLATAITLTKQLISAYRNHYTDAVKVTGSRSYHSNSLGVNPGAPNVLLIHSSDPVTWLDVAERLNDLKIKFNWHMRSYKGHPISNPFNAGTDWPDVISATSLSNTERGPIFSDISYTDVITLVNNLKLSYAAHLSDTVVDHPLANAFNAETDTSDVTNLSAASDYNSAAELIFQLYACYRDHQADAASPQYWIVANDHTLLADRNKLFSAKVGFTDNYQGTLTQLSADLLAGKTLRTNGASTSTSKYALGTTISSISGSTITLSANHDNAAGADEAAKSFLFSSMRYHMYYSSGLHAPTADPSPALSTLSTSLTFDQAANDLGNLNDMLKDMCTKFNHHDNNAYTHLLASDFGGNNQLVINDTGTTHRYLYAFLYSNTYATVAGETFTDYSTPYYKTKVCLKTIANSPTAITNMNSIANGATGNYDTSNIHTEVYRTVDNGTQLKLSGYVANGTTTYTDSTADAELAANNIIYTDGGVVNNDPPPIAKYLHITGNNFAYYGNIVDGADSFPNRVRQSIGNDPDSCPGSFFVDLPYPNNGISSTRNLPIAFTAKSAYRLEGFFDELGNGEIRAVPISDSVGLIGPISPVQIDGGVIYAGTDGFYFTDAYRCFKLSQSFNSTYKTLVSTATRAGNIVGTYDSYNNRVWYGASYGGSENDTCFVLDLQWGLKSASCFTTASNGVYFSPTSLCMFNKQLIRGDVHGYVFKHDPTYLTDPKLDTTGVNTAGSAWTAKAIIYDIKSVGIDFNAGQKRKWVTKIESKFDNGGNLSCQIKSINDVGRTTNSLAPIRYRGSANTGMIEEIRRFISGELRCFDKQIEYTNATVIIDSSDNQSTATLNHAAKTLTLTNAAKTFPTDPVDYVIYLDNDNYVQGYTISVSTTSILITVTDPGNLLPVNGVYKWVVKGVPKGESFSLHEFTLWHDIFGTTEMTAGNEATGANA